MLAKTLTHKVFLFSKVPFASAFKQERERLKMELEKMKPKKKEKALEPGSLRTREEYTKIFISLKKVQKMFVEKHHLSCRPLANSPFFMD